MTVKPETPAHEIGWAETPRTERTGTDLIQETPTPSARKCLSRWDETPSSQLGNQTPQTPSMMMPMTPMIPVTPSGVTATGTKTMGMATRTPDVTTDEIVPFTQPIASNAITAGETNTKPGELINENSDDGNPHGCCACFIEALKTCCCCCWGTEEEEPSIPERHPEETEEEVPSITERPGESPEETLRTNDSIRIVYSAPKLGVIGQAISDLFIKEIR